MQKLNSKKCQRMLEAASVGWLLVVGLMIFCPTALQNADKVSASDGVSTDQAATMANVYVQSSISVALRNRMDVDVTPKANGSFAASSTKMAVATNNSTGYSIFMNTLDGTQDLSRVNSENGEKIVPVVGKVNENGFPANSWGYKLVKQDETDDGLYQAVPGETVKVKDVPTHNSLVEYDDFDLSLGVSVNTQLPAGTYKNGIMVSVVANPRELKPFSEAIYMQEIDTTVCQSAEVGETKQLIDIRDNKKYWVGKMADGKCWMNQNLALDLDENTPLTPALSDVSAEWVPKTTESSLVGMSTSNTDTRSWSVANRYVLAAPLTRNVCNTIQNEQALENCSVIQKIDDDWSYAPAMDGVWGDYSGLVTVDRDKMTYDSHYLLGNYYSWNTATAGTGGTIVSRDAAGSICPKGWRLPTVSQQSSLFSGYGIGSNLTGTKDGVEYHVLRAPLAYVRGGGINPGTGSLKDLGDYAGYWLSTAYSTTRSAYLLVIDSVVRTGYINDGHFDRNTGTSIRCLVR